MIDVSTEFRTLMEERTDFKQNAVLTFEDGTSLELGEEDFTLSTNNTVTDGADAGGLPLGEAVCRSIQVELMNDEDWLASYSFTGAKIRLYLTFTLSETTEKVELGTFTVVSPEVYSTTVIITAVDDMYLADRAYSSSLTYPTTLRQMFLEIVDLCGLAYTTANFNNYDYSVAEAPDSGYTCREVLGFIAMIAGGNAHIDRKGYLEILTYDFDGEDRHELVNWKSLTLDASDITITGVQNTVTVDEEDTTCLYGEEGYVLAVENPLIYGDEDNALALIGENLVGRSFRKFEGTHIAYPLAEFMDLCTVTDWKGNSYQSVITDVNFVFFGLTTLRNSAESGLRNASEYNSAGTTAVISAKRNTVTGMTTLYAVSDSVTEAPESGWAAIPPDVEDGQYLWQMTRTTYASGKTADSTPVSISGRDGEDGEDAVVMRIDSSRGTVFKNAAVSTVLSVVIYYGSLRITDSDALASAFGASAYLEWSWQKMDESTFGVISASDSRLSDGGFSFALSPDDVDTKAVFQCTLNI
ncbi:MAG: hypothetical protein LUC30_10345 [Clostridiales bacterium]|nr:hypothetical protein [Clostridiales bacterium]